MNQNTTINLYRDVCDSFDVLKDIRNTLYNHISVSDNGELTNLPTVLEIIPHSQMDNPCSEGPLFVSQAYAADKMLFLVQIDFQICANLIPIECLLPVFNKPELKDLILSVRENIKRVIAKLIEEEQTNLYFEPANDSLDCLRSKGDYIKVSSLFFNNGILMAAGTDCTGGTAETCLADDIFVEDLCGLLIGHLCDL